MNKQGQSGGTKLFQWRKQTGERYLNRFKRRVLRENRLREFNFTFIHRIVVTKKELCRFNIKSDSNCIYCRKPDSIDHTLLECQFTKSFTQEVLQWFKADNKSNINLNTDDFLFGLSSVLSV